MNKKLITLALSGILYVSPTFAFTQTQSAVQSTADYAQVVSKRQVVDQLLEQAVTAFKSPARISHAGFTAKMPSNMEIVTDRLLQAYQLEPYRTDLLISAANAQIYNKNVDRAIELFEQVLSVAPDDVDANAYLAVWQHFKGNNQAANKHLKKLEQLDSGKAADIQRIFETVDRIVATPLKSEMKEPKAGNTAIITLGYALNPDGTMNDILIERLNMTLKIAKEQPNSLIILTGGVPQNNQTEGRLMADWLIKQGINPNRLIEDNYARSTVENALYSSYALARHKIKHATIISSASHVRRGQTLFEIASWQTGPQNITFDTIGAPDKPLEELAKPSQGELLGIYRDALRTYGMWSYRSYPLEQR